MPSIEVDVHLTEQPTLHEFDFAAWMDLLDSHRVQGDAGHVLWTTFAGAHLSALKLGSLQGRVGWPNLEHVAFWNPRLHDVLGRLIGRFERANPGQ